MKISLLIVAASLLILTSCAPTGRHHSSHFSSLEQFEKAEKL